MECGERRREAEGGHQPPWSVRREGERQKEGISPHGVWGENERGRRVASAPMECGEICFSPLILEGAALLPPPPAPSHSSWKGMPHFHPSCPSPLILEGAAPLPPSLAP